MVDIYSNAMKKEWIRSITSNQIMCHSTCEHSPIRMYYVLFACMSVSICTLYISLSLCPSVLFVPLMSYNVSLLYDCEQLMWKILSHFYKIIIRT